MTRHSSGSVSSTASYTREEIALLVPEDELQLLEAEAIRAVNQELARSEDLHVTVPQLLTSCRNEVAEVRKAINSIVSTQTGEAYRSRRILKEASEKVEQLRDAFVDQGTILSSMQTAACYRQLKQLSVLRSNVQRIIKWTEALKSIHHVQFDSELQKGNFLEIYERLCETQDIRSAVMKGVSHHKGASDAFDPYFMKLDTVLEIFVDRVRRVFEDSTMIAIFHVLGDDNDDDDDASNDDSSIGGGVKNPFKCLSDCIEICSRESVNPATHIRSGYNVAQQLSEAAVATWVEESVSRTWVDEIMGDVTDPMNQMFEYLEAMKKLEQILVALELAVAPLSSQFPFFALMVKAFHGEIMRLMRKYADPEAQLEATKLLDAIKFLRWYHQVLEDNNFKQYVQIESIDAIIADMMKEAVNGMSRHLAHLSQSCALTTCGLEPKSLPSGLVFSTGPTDLFTILQQSLGTITSNLEAEVAQKLAKACADGIRAYVDECRKQMDFDLWEDEKSSVPDWASKRLQFLYAFCNDTSNIEENVEVLEGKFASAWSDDVDETPFQEIQLQLSEFATFYVDEIIDHVNRLLGEEWKKVCFQPVWCTDETNPMRTILDTLADYMDEEFSIVLNDPHAKKVTKSLMFDSFRRYLNNVVRFMKETADVKWKTEEHVNSFRTSLIRDADMLHAFWAERVTPTRLQLVDQGRAALITVAELVSSASSPQLFEKIVRNRVIESFGDCPSFVIQYAIDKRGDLSKSAREQLIATWKARIEYQHRENDVFAGWKSGQTFLGGIDRDLAPEAKAGFFKKKKVKEDETTKKLRLKNEKRKAREDEANAKKASASKRAVVADGKKPSDVEVESLSSLLS